MKNRQTLAQLSTKYNLSIPTIKKHINNYEVPTKAHNPREVYLVCDAVFFGKRKHKGAYISQVGTLVFKDAIIKEVLVWKHIDKEVASDYAQLRDELLKLGYTILGVSVDGKNGLYSVFRAYPVQLCIFHQLQTIQRYISKYPRYEATKALKKITFMVKDDSTKDEFVKALNMWHDKYKDFINEKNDSGKYKHQKARSAYSSLRRNAPYLFTHKEMNNAYKNSKGNTLSYKPPNTINALEGGLFSHMKSIINIHRGLSKKMVVKMVDYCLIHHYMSV